MLQEITNSLWRILDMGSENLANLMNNHMESTNLYGSLRSA